MKNVFDEAIHAVLKDQSKYSKEILASQVAKAKKGAEGQKKCLIF